MSTAWTRELLVDAVEFWKQEAAEANDQVANLEGELELMTDSMDFWKEEALDAEASAKWWRDRYSDERAAVHKLRAGAAAALAENWRLRDDTQKLASEKAALSVELQNARAELAKLKAEKRPAEKFAEQPAAKRLPKHLDPSRPEFGDFPDQTGWQ